MTQYTLKDNNKATDIMWDAGLGGGGPWVHCGCGKDHSITDEEFVNSGYDGFRYIDLDGKMFVEGCDGCEKLLGKYERFIWENRDTIRRYLKKRIDQEKAWADQEHVLNTLADI
jgi:hypothetical protein